MVSCLGGCPFSLLASFSLFLPLGLHFGLLGLDFFAFWPFGPAYPRLEDEEDEVGYEVEAVHLNGNVPIRKKKSTVCQATSHPHLEDGDLEVVHLARSDGKKQVAKAI